MNNQQQRIYFINTTMDEVHNLCNDLYEALIDEQFNDVDMIASDIEEILKYLKETFQNEI